MSSSSSPTSSSHGRCQWGGEASVQQVYSGCIEVSTHNLKKIPSYKKSQLLNKNKKKNRKNILDDNNTVTCRRRRRHPLVILSDFILMCLHGSGELERQVRRRLGCTARIATTPCDTMNE
jgi:hypothetical protein